MFARYCEQFGFTCTKIPTGNCDTPDFEVDALGQRLVVEIKEQSPNDEDHRYFKDLLERGIAELTPNPGRRINYDIKKAVKQLGKHADRCLPLVLLISDNIRVDERWVYGEPNHFLTEVDLDKGMYGDTGSCYVWSSIHELPQARAVRINARQLEAHRNEHLSAIGVLCENRNREVFVHVYHNYFATVPLPPTVFAGPYDRSFRKRAEPATSLGDWFEDRVKTAVD